MDLNRPRTRSQHDHALKRWCRKLNKRKMTGNGGNKVSSDSPDIVTSRDSSDEDNMQSNFNLFRSRRNEKGVKRNGDYYRTSSDDIKIIGKTDGPVKKTIGEKREKRNLRKRGRKEGWFSKKDNRGKSKSQKVADTDESDNDNLRIIGERSDCSLNRNLKKRGGKERRFSKKNGREKSESQTGVETDESDNDDVQIIGERSDGLFARSLKKNGRQEKRFSTKDNREKTESQKGFDTETDTDNVRIIGERSDGLLDRNLKKRGRKEKRFSKEDSREKSDSQKGVVDESENDVLFIGEKVDGLFDRNLKKRGRRKKMFSKKCSDKGKKVDEYVTITESSEELSNSEVSYSDSAYSSESLCSDKGKKVDEYVTITESSEELSNSEVSYSYSSESLYKEGKESSSNDEMVPSSDNNVSESEEFEREVKNETRNVARKRCQKPIEPTKIKKDKDMLGSFSCPYTLIDEEEDVLSESNKRDVSEDIERGNKDKQKVVRPAKNVHDDPISKINKILVDSMWQEGEIQLENLVSPIENPPDEIESLPSKFPGFDTSDEDTEIPCKSFWDLEGEKLFKELNYSLGIYDYASSDAVMVDSEENIPSRIKNDPASSCQDGGKHRPILDDQVGLRCMKCFAILQEIRDQMPEFAKNQGGRAESRDFYRGNYSNIGVGQIDHFTAARFTDDNRHFLAKGTVWDLIPGIRDKMQLHQREGFEFIWKNIAGSILIDNAKKCISDGGGSGCLMAHSPGTGKTMLTIGFLQAYMQLNPNCRPLIVAPCTVLATWEKEFCKWDVGIPFHNLNKTDFSGQESARAVNLLQSCNRQRSSESTRLVKLLSWKNEKSVLGISYPLFEELASANAMVVRAQKKREGKDNDVAGEIRKMLLVLPGILILDEGHIPRNHESQIWKALLEVQTERRIMLSGTPFQNNFEELLNTFCVVLPKFSDKIFPQTRGHNTEKKRRIKNATREIWDLMTKNICKDNQKLKEFKDMIDEFVHVYKGSNLKEKVPGLKDSLVVLSPTNLQKNLSVIAQRWPSSFQRDHIQSLISVHPSLSLSCTEFSEKEKLNIPRDELESLWLNPIGGVKTNFLTELVRLSGLNKERVLIFSQYIDSLKLVMKQLINHFHWTEGIEILFMGGEHGEKQRQLSIKRLNDPESEVRVLLASSRAFSEGINLVGASRVVLLDVNWNPSITRQSISRAYRIGQKKVVHVYHLIGGTWEMNKFVKTAFKDRISDVIFSSKDGADKSGNSSSVGEDIILQDMVEHPKMSSVFIEILNLSKESDLIDMFAGAETENLWV